MTNVLPNTLDSFENASFQTDNISRRSTSYDYNIPYPICDIHAHIYPEKIAAKAADVINAFYEMKQAAEGNVTEKTLEHVDRFIANMTGEDFTHPDMRGTATGLLAECTQTPIRKFVVHSVATTPKQVETINTFIANECAAHPEFIGFATMHQDFENVAAELDRARSLGLVGVKLHPDFQECAINDERFMLLYEEAERRNMPVIIHTGDYRYDYSHPRHLVEVLHTFPRLVVNAAHMGGWGIQDQGVKYLANERCYVDSSSTIPFLTTSEMRDLIDIFGTKRILFGADFPMWNPACELERFLNLGLSAADNEKVFIRNAEDFLSMNLG